MQEANSTSAPRFNKRKTPKVPKKISEEYLANSGKFYLERFPASVGQFRRVMTRKIQKSCRAHPDQSADSCAVMLEKVIEKFCAIGFLNDEGYAGGLARSLKNRGWPRTRIVMRLKQKGVAADLIETLFESREPKDDFHDALVWIKRKKIGPFASREKPFDKQLASLARAGFDYDVSNRALKMTKDEIEESLAGAL